MQALVCIVKNNKRFLLLLLAASFVLRVALFVFFTSHGTNALIPFDSDQYRVIAHTIVQGGGIGFEPGVPQFYRVPGYPLFLAGCDLLFGQNGALWLQIVLASFIPILIFMLGLTVFPGNLMLAKIAGMLACVHLGFIVYAGMLATESLCCIFLLLFFICLFAQFPFCAGAFLGIASLIRPVGHYLLPVALAYFCYRKLRLSLNESCHPRLNLGFILPITLGWLLFVTPWLLRNFLLTGSLFFHTLPGLHCVQYVATPIVAQRDVCDYAKARERVMYEYHTQCSGDMNNVSDCKVGEALALKYVKQYPLYAFKHFTTEIIKTYFGLYSAIILLADQAVWPVGYITASWWTKIKRFLCPTVQRTWLIPLIYWDILMMLCISCGFLFFLAFGFFDARLRRAFVFILPFVTMLIALTFAYGGARLRMPAEPLLLLGAVAGWSRLWGYISEV